MDQFPSNSRKAPEAGEPKDVQQVTTASQVRRKRGLGRKFRDVFIGGDARSAAAHMFEDVVVPGARDMIWHAVQDWFENWIYGDSRPRRGPSTGGYSNVGRFNYQGIMSGGQQSKPTAQPRTISRQARARHDFADLVIPSHNEANEVIDRMYEILSRFGQVSVADLYELTGVRSDHTDVKWGWYELRGARARPMRSGGYLLDLPQPEPFE